MEILDTLSGVVARHLWAVSLQAGVLALFALLAERLFRNAPPSFRYWLWMLVVLRLAAPVDFAVPFGMRETIQKGVGNAVERLHNRLEPQSALPNMQVSGAIPLPAMEPGNLLPTAAPTRAHARSFSNAVMISWAGIAVLLLCIALFRTGFVRYRLRNSHPVEHPEFLRLIDRLCRKTGIPRRVRLFRAPAHLLHAPAVTGFFRPRIWLPEAMVDRWIPEDAEPILLHELAHIKRHDLILNGLQAVIQAVYFFHPIVWLANARIRRAREEICDDMAIVLLRSERKRYSLSMIRVGEEILQQKRFSFAGIGFSERKSLLGERVRRIMNGKYTPHRRLTAGAFAILALVAAAGTMLAGGSYGAQEKAGSTASIPSMSSSKSTKAIHSGKVDSGVNESRTVNTVHSGQKAHAPSPAKEKKAEALYEKTFALFSQAKQKNNPFLYQQAVTGFRAVVEKYPGTQSEISAYVNMGFAYEELGEFRKAVNAYEMVIRKYSRGESIPPEAVTFARLHKSYIVANRL